jgi:hypothetical protein
VSISTTNPQVATLTRYRFVAAGSETSVSGIDANGAVLAYVAGKEQVYLNGVLMVRGQDYTATNGTSITALSALALNDVVEVLTFSEFVIANAVDQTLVNTKGDLIVATADNVVTNVAVGANNTMLVADSAQTAGVKWTDALTASILVSPEERTTVSATAATGTVQFDADTQGVLYYTTNASANWTLNVRGTSGTTLASKLAVGDSSTISFLVTQGSTAYYMTALTIDGNAQTVKYSGGTAPSAGNASAVDAYTFTIVKTAATPTYTVFGAGPVKYA